MDKVNSIKPLIKYFILLLMVVLATVLFKQCTEKKVEPTQIIAN